jgi:hypothetical protein
MKVVDLNSDVRWTTEQRRARTEALVQASVPLDVERILMRRLLSFVLYVLAQLLPVGHPLKPLLSAMGKPLSPEAVDKLAAAVGVFNEVEQLADQADADIALLNRVLDAEQGLAPLAEDDTAGQQLLATRAAARPSAPDPEPPVDTEGGEA